MSASSENLLVREDRNSSKKAFLNVFIIGAASSSCSEGQLPDAENLREFEKKYPFNVYYHFIDPSHRNDKDSKIFDTYIGIHYSVSYFYFSFDAFMNQFLILKDDKALFIDYSGYSQSEYDFIDSFGINTNWHYLSLGCFGEKVNMDKLYVKARNIPIYTIYSNMPIPCELLSKEYRIAIRNELDKLLTYIRLLPLINTDPEPPEWLVKQDDIIRSGDRTTWAYIRESAEQSLAKWFKVNGKYLYNYDSSAWSGVIRNLCCL